MANDRRQFSLTENDLFEIIGRLFVENSMLKKELTEQSKERKDVTLQS